MRSMVLFTAFYALLSLGSLFWSVFLDSDLSDNPGKHTFQDEILDKQAKDWK